MINGDCDRRDHPDYVTCLSQADPHSDVRTCNEKEILWKNICHILAPTKGI
jgi:hypothetical protein